MNTSQVLGLRSNVGELMGLVGRVLGGLADTMLWLAVYLAARMVEVVLLALLWAVAGITAGLAISPQAGGALVAVLLIEKTHAWLSQFMGKQTTTFWSYFLLSAVASVVLVQDFSLLTPVFGCVLGVEILWWIQWTFLTLTFESASIELADLYLLIWWPLRSWLGDGCPVCQRALPTGSRQAARSHLFRCWSAWDFAGSSAIGGAGLDVAYSDDELDAPVSTVAELIRSLPTIFLGPSRLWQRIQERRNENATG